jgi:hypothetical protein
VLLVGKVDEDFTERIPETPVSNTREFKQEESSWQITNPLKKEIVSPKHVVCVIALIRPK